MSEGLPIRDELERYYREKADPELQISNFVSISDGWETEVYSFTATLRHQVEHLILRMYPGAESLAAERCKREYEAMSLMHPIGHYPVPIVMRHETDMAWLGKPFIIMQKIEGQSLGRTMAANPVRSIELLQRFCQLFVDLHHINYEPFLLLFPVTPPNDPYAFLRSKLAFAHALIVAQLKQSWAIPVLAWLEAHMMDVANPTLAVLHGDFNWSNVLLTPNDKPYVIDWSQVEVGDYRYDLAWTLLLTQPPEAREFTLQEYAHLSGHPVEQLEYFEVIACLRRLFDLSASLTSGAESLGMRPDTVEIMRRQRDHYQQVYALLKNITGLSLPDIERLIDSLGST